MEQKKILDCPKCGGTGTISRYNHIMIGVCFRCKGIGKIESNYNSYKPKKRFAIYINNENTFRNIIEATNEKLAIKYYKKCNSNLIIKNNIIGKEVDYKGDIIICKN